MSQSWRSERYQNRAMRNAAGKGAPPKSWALHRSSGNSNISLYGETLVEAIEANFNAVIAGEARLGNAAGYWLVSVVASYRPGILGGKGGVEVVIQHRGQDLAHWSAGDEVSTSVVWIHAAPEDLPEVHVFDLRES